MTKEKVETLIVSHDECGIKHNVTLFQKDIFKKYAYSETCHSQNKIKIKIVVSFLSFFISTFYFVYGKR